jgi:hypothetical protein
MKNKEVIAKLQEYLLTQDPKIVAYACACVMVDMSRLASLDDLPEKEAVSLIGRIYLNARQLSEFIRLGGLGTLDIVNLGSDED